MERDEFVHSQSYRGDAASLGPARHEATRWLGLRGASADLRERAALVVNELAANAIDAAPGHPFEVRLAYRPSQAVLSVTNCRLAGEAVPPRADWKPENPLAGRGRGLAIVDRLSRRVTVDQEDDDRVTVSVVLDEADDARR